MVFIFFPDRMLKRLLKSKFSEFLGHSLILYSISKSGNPLVKQAFWKRGFASKLVMEYQKYLQNEGWKNLHWSKPPIKMPRIFYYFFQSYSANDHWEKKSMYLWGQMYNVTAKNRLFQHPLCHCLSLKFCS